jgi:6-phosphofructokinase 1
MKKDAKIKNKEIKSIGVLCSGGDSPGMNCAIRSVVRSAINSGLKIYGIQRGYTGLLSGAIYEMDASSVGNIIHKGGTILQTTRCKEFFDLETRKEAFHILQRKGIDGLIVIGGNGSLKGAMKLYEENEFPIVGIPGSIDNDISGTDYSIGFDTAVQTAIDSVDKIRDTANSHERTFIVEVMGRKSPAIALHVGICTGAENIVFPSQTLNIKEIYNDIKRGMERGKNSSIIIVAEGETPGLSYEVQSQLKKQFNIEAHVCILGHIQRGGKPTAVDRFMGSQMGYLAVKALKEKNYPVVVASNQGSMELISINKCLKKKKEYESHYLELVKTLSI